MTETATKPAPTATGKWRFERVLRKCGFNDDILRNNKPKNLLLYDFDVFDTATGLKIAVMSRNGFNSRGYRLYDLGNTAILDEQRTVKFVPRFYECKSQGDFVELMERAAPFIPTAEQVAERKAKAEAEAKARAVKAREDSRRSVIQSAGFETYTMLKKLMHACSGTLEQSYAALAEAEAYIKKLEADADGVDSDGSQS